MKKIENLAELEILMTKFYSFFFSEEEKEKEKEKKSEYKKLLDELSILKSKKEISEKEIHLLARNYLLFEKKAEHVSLLPMKRNVSSLITVLVYISIIVESWIFLTDVIYFSFSLFTPLFFGFNAWFVLAECRHDDWYTFIDRAVEEWQYSLVYHPVYLPVMWTVLLSWFFLTEKTITHSLFLIIMFVLTVAQFYFKKSFKHDQIRKTYL